MAFLDRTTWKWTLGCSVNSNECVWGVVLILAFMQKTYIPGLARLATITAYEHLHGMYQRVPKHCRAFGQQIVGGNWTKMVWKICVWCTWTKLTLLCFLAFTLWSIDWWARKKARKNCCLPGKVQACFDGVDSERVSTSCLAHRCVLRRQRESESWKTDNKSCLLS